MHKTNYILFTGAPGVGKTTLIEALRASGELCVDETHRAVIREHAERGVDIRADQTHYRDLCGRRDLDKFDAHLGESRPVFFDRGLPDSFVGDSLDPPWLPQALATRRYNGVVFMPPPWPEIFAQDTERTQDFEEALRVHDRIGRTLVSLGYDPVELPKASVKDRVTFVLSRIGRAL
jgi:predicted ATPase